MNRTRIREDLRQGVSIDEVCKKYNMSFKALMRFMNDNRGYKSRAKMKYISRNGRNFRIVRQVNGKQVYYGSFKSLKEAIKVRDKLVESEWKLSSSEYLGMMYIREMKSCYQIHKSINGKQKHIASFKSLDEAMKVRDALVKFDWDLDYLDLICKQVGADKIGG